MRKCIIILLMLERFLNICYLPTLSRLSNEKTLTEKNSRKRYCDRGQR